MRLKPKSIHLEKRKGLYRIGIMTEDKDKNEVLSYPSPLMNLKDAEVIKCWRTIDRGKPRPSRVSEAEATFYAYCEEDRSFYESLKDQYDVYNKPRVETPEESAEEKKEEKPPIEKTNWDEIMTKWYKKDPNRRLVVESIACAVLAPKYKFTNMPALAIVGGSSIGKSTTISFFDDSRIAFDPGKCTMHAYQPGRSGSGDEERSGGVLAAANGKTILHHEFQSVAEEGELAVSRWVGLLCDTLGTGRSIVSDGAEVGRVDETWYNMILGITWRNYARFYKAMKDIGSRFFLVPFYTNFDVKYTEQDTRGSGSPKEEFVSHILNTLKKYDKVPDYSQEMKDLAEDFVKRVIKLQDSLFTSSEKKMDHFQRYWNMILNASVLRAMLYDRKATIDDVRYFFPLLRHTVPYLDVFLRIYKNPTSLEELLENYNEKQAEGKKSIGIVKNMIKNCVELGVLLFDKKESEKYIIAIGWRKFMDVMSDGESFNDVLDVDE